MLETLVELAVYVIVGLVALAVVGWNLASGQAFSIDGLLLTFVCLSVAVVFLGALALGVRSGDFDDVLKRARHKNSGTARPSGSATGAST